jgi:hypothetical protein
LQYQLYISLKFNCTALNTGLTVLLPRMRKVGWGPSRPVGTVGPEKGNYSRTGGSGKKVHLHRHRSKRNKRVPTQAEMEN